jgi:hypothetical protein
MANPKNNEIYRKQGLLGESIVQQLLIQQGWSVRHSDNPNAAIDAWVSRGGVLRALQIKTTFRRRERTNCVLTDLLSVPCDKFEKYRKVRHESGQPLYLVWVNFDHSMVYWADLNCLSETVVVDRLGVSQDFPHKETLKYTGLNINLHISQFQWLGTISHHYVTLCNKK